MINKYCYKCGAEMFGKGSCSTCSTLAIEMPKSKVQQDAIENIKKIQEENKPKKGTGCLVMIVLGFVMFGIPAIFNFLGYGIISFSIVSVVLLFINIKIFKFRKNMGFKKQNKYFDMTRKTKNDFANREKICLSCGQLLTDKMVFCPNCSRPTGEDIPIDPTNKSKIQTNLEEKKIEQKIEKVHVPCRKCGVDVEGKKFCEECGTKVEVN